MWSFVAVMMLATAAVFAGDTSKEFKVYGNCGMCESRIEKAAQDVEGVSKADWNKETKMMAVTFNDAKTNVEKVHKAVAAVGHDTKMHKASDEVYKNLPGCCQYDRKDAECSSGKAKKAEKKSGCSKE